MLFTWKAWEILFPFFLLHVVVVLFYCGTAIYNKSLKFHGFSRMLANVKSPRCIWLKGWVVFFFFLQIYPLFYPLHLSFMFPSLFILLCWFTVNVYVCQARKSSRSAWSGSLFCLLWLRCFWPSGVKGVHVFLLQYPNTLLFYNTAVRWCCLVFQVYVANCNCPQGCWF